MNKTDYPRLRKLGVHIYNDPSPHVKAPELTAALRRAGINEQTFKDLLSSQTCLICEGVPGLYPYDIESTLCKLESSTVASTQLLID